MWSYAKWEKKIQNAFETKFWISEEPDLKIEGEETGLINKRGIYKDCYKATHRFTDYQLRPNFPMAMAVVGIFYSTVTFNSLTLIEWARRGKYVLWTFCGDRDRQCHSQ